MRAAREEYERARQRAARSTWRRHEPRRRAGPVTPTSAGWTYVGFEVAALAARGRARHRRARALHRRALRALHVRSVARRLARPRRPPRPVLRPARRRLPAARHALRARGRRRGRALQRAGAGDGAPARVLPGADVEPETRGHGAHERTIHPILMGDEEADSLLVCEVLTPAGPLVELPAAQARPRRDARGVLPRGDLLPPHQPAAGLRAPARLHRRRLARRDAHRPRRRHRARAARLPHRLRPARLRRCTTST